MFVDKAQIEIKAGDGGDGAINFRHEKFVDRGGPDGGDGGNGGSVIFVASRNESTLSLFRHDKSLKAVPGGAGSKQNKHGKSGENLIIKVPVGTSISNEEGELLIDLTEDGQQEVVSPGGRGGFGNAHFVSSVRQAPKFSEPGEIVEPMNLKLELKMIADVGLVGLPNAGKSTLLASLSNARPAIADYPFTTLIPNLGVVDINKSQSLLFADIPGLIEGASSGKGLGIDFLKHIERTLVIVHLVDVYNEDIAKSYKTIQAELKSYQIDLTKRPEIVVINKIDGYDKAELKKKMAALKKVIPKATKLVAISAFSKENLKEFLIELDEIVRAEKDRKLEEAEVVANEIPVLKLKDTTNRWNVEKTKDGFEVKGFRIEKFAGRTDFENEQSVARLKDIMKKMGIIHELVRMKAKSGDKIKLGRFGSIEF